MSAIDVKGNGPEHNHVWIYTEGYQDDCPRCNFLRAAKEAAGETQHNHARMPFGRRVEGCPRCAELASGAPKREGMHDHRDRLERQRSEDIRRHFADPNSTCNHITCFDW